MIYKMFDGKHIDLSKILEISPAYFVDSIVSGGWFVEFYIQYQLRDNPITYTYKSDQFIVIDYKHVRDNSPESQKYREGYQEAVCRELQFHVDDIIAAWNSLVSPEKPAPEEPSYNTM